MAFWDFLVNLGAGLANNMVMAVGREACYCYQFNTLVSDLGDEKDNLIATRDTMLVQVRKAEANNQEPSKDILKQLKETNDLIEKAGKLEGKAEASKSCCYHGVCPKWIRRYNVGKQASRMKEAMNKLNGELRPKLFFAHNQSLRPMATSRDFILFECTKKALDELITALKDNEIVMIGLYGMGGCGKSSLLEQVRKAAEDSKLFDKVVNVTVTFNPIIQNIQGGIARWLGLRLETEENEPERAARLSMRLNDGSRYLIILDDVWEVLKFEKIGIPLGENCRVLLGTRQRNICTLMDCQKVIHLSLLTKDEAWVLFKKHAGIITDSFEGLAQAITNECHQLPIAIKAVASTLKGKPLVVWENAFDTLRNGAPLDIEHGLDNPYKCLKLSYDHLVDDGVRSLFLLCALFPEDSEISIEVLIRFAFGLGIFEDVDSYKTTRSKVGAAINKVTDYCLLLHSEEGQYVKMHDLVRDVALWLTDKKTQLIMGHGQSLKAVIEKGYMKDTRTLYCHDATEFPSQLNCPNLEVLYMSSDGGYSSKFPDTFLKETKDLKVLAIKNRDVWINPILLLPLSIEGLIKLRTLCLRGWTLDNISVWEKLERLDTIELLNCVMKELPSELAELRRLRLLEVAGCTIGSNPYEVLARCSQLEELYFTENNYPQKLSNDHGVAELFHQVAYSKSLQRYHLEIGSSIETLKDDSPSRFMSINNLNAASTSNEAMKVLAHKLEVLFLENVQGDCKNIIPDMIPTEEGCMNELTEFLLRDSDNIECLIDTTTHQLFQFGTVFSKLLKLKLEAMKCLEVLCRGPPPSGLFGKLENLSITECIQFNCLGKLNLCSLKFLELEECSKLTSLFTPSTAQTMDMLEVLKVRDCAVLKHIIKGEEENDIISLRPVFPKLKQVSVKGCEHLECIISVSFAGGLSQLEILEIEDAREMKIVFGKSDSEENQNQDEFRGIDLPVLKVFKLIDLPNIISICPHNYHITWPSLHKPYIRGCQQLSSIIDFDSEVTHQGSDQSKKQLNVVNDLSKVVEKREGKAITNNICCLGNWIWQCRTTRKMVNEAKEITDTTEISKIIQSSSPTTCPGVEKISSPNNLLFLNSTKLAYDDLLESLVVDDEHSIIGLCGEEGCGKTTLAKVVSKAAKQYFDVVIFVVVSSFSFQKIKARIAGHLPFLDQSDVLGREKLHESERVKFCRKRILIILDDVQQQLNYEELGIPFDRNDLDCNVLLTTTMYQVCALNNCRRVIHVHQLSEEEALIMFQEFAEITQDVSHISKVDVAQEIVCECKRLAIAIKIAAVNLKGKSLGKCMELLETLRDSRPLNIEDGRSVIYAMVKFCYDNLENEATKSLFLLCSVFPEDYEIQEEDLTRYGTGLGLFGEFVLYERVREQVSSAKNKLIDCCLLLRTNSEQSVKMHNMVRFAALWIAKVGNKEIVGLETSGNELHKYMTMKSSTIRYLWLNKVDSFLYEVDFSRLDFLFISFTEAHGKNPFLDDDFFKGMKGLRVLVLENDDGSLNEKPSMCISCQYLTSLRCLHLRGWKFSDMSFLESLTRLETLRLWDCSFQELPSGITKLANLILLDLLECEFVKNPLKMLARCSRLQELYLHDHFGLGWKDYERTFAKFFSNTLQRYHIGWGPTSASLHKRSTLRNFCVWYLDASTLNERIKSLIQRAEVLNLSYFRGNCKNIIPEMVQKLGGCMSETTALKLFNCDEIEYLVDTSQNLVEVEIIFPRLVSLHLVWMNHLKALFNGPFPNEQKMQIFCNLKVLELIDCAIFTVFTPITSQSLAHLEELEIARCHELRHILTDEEGLGKRTRNLVFLKLKRLCIYWCKKLEYITSASYAKGFVHLEELVIQDASLLKQLFSHSELKDLDHNELHIISFPAMRQVHLSSLTEMTSIFPENCYPTWSSLQQMKLVDCPKLNIISINNPIVGRTILEDRIQLESLQIMRIHGCSKLKCIFPLSTARNLSQLRELVIVDCRLLENIIEDEEYDFQNSGPFNLCNLGRLVVSDCPMLRSLFSTSTAKTLTSMVTLKIEECPKLEYVIKDEQVEEKRSEDIVQDDGKCVLPKIKILCLANLPSLINVHRQFKLQNVKLCQVCDCPLLQNQTTAAISEDLPQEYEIPALEERRRERNREIGEKSGTKEEEEGAAAAQEDDEEEDYSDNEDYYHSAAEIDHPTPEFDSIVYTQEWPMKQNFYPEMVDDFQNGKEEDEHEEVEKVVAENPCLDLHHRVQVAAESNQKAQEFDQTVKNQQGLEEHNVYQAASKNLRESDTEIGKESVLKDVELEESKVANSPLELASEQKDGREEQKHKEDVIPKDNIVFDQNTTSCMESTKTHEAEIGNSSTTVSGIGKVDAVQQDGNLNEDCQWNNNDIPGSDFHRKKQDSAAEVDLQSQGFDVIVDNQEGFQAENFYLVGSINLREVYHTIPYHQSLIPLLENYSQKSNIEIGKESVHKDPALEQSTVATSSHKLAEKLPHVELELSLASEDPQHKDLCYEVPTTAEVGQQRQEFNSSVKNQEGFQEHNFYPAGLKNLTESETRIAKESVHKDVAAEEFKVELTNEYQDRREEHATPKYSSDSTKGCMESSESHKEEIKNSCTGILGTSKLDLVPQDDNLNEENQRSNNDIPSGFSLDQAADSNVYLQKQDVQAPTSFHVQSQVFDVTDVSLKSLQEQLVGSVNLIESNTKMEKGINHKDHAPEESKLATSSSELVMKLPQVEPELPQLAKNPQQTLQEFEVSQATLSSSSAIAPNTETLTSSSSFPTHACLLDEARACLLDEAFSKYPHLREWKISQKSTRFCKWGYESLVDMLEFLNSETPRTMNSSKMKKFEDLCTELECFGFNKEWLASIRQRVMERQVDLNDKLNLLESTMRNLQDQLNIAVAKIDCIKDEISKVDNVFGL